MAKRTILPSLAAAEPSADASRPRLTEQHGVFHKLVHLVKIGQSYRFGIRFEPYSTPEEYAQHPPQSLYVRVRNTEPAPYRAAYLAGPYVLYVDCKNHNYDPNEKVFVTAEQPVFEPQLGPGQSFSAELLCRLYKEAYEWDVDVISQIIFNSSISINFEIAIGTKAALEADSAAVERHSRLYVTSYDTLDLWNLPVPNLRAPVHLVILTHGLHSNVLADMLYIKEQIDRSGENVVVKGFLGNAGKTERGVKYLGSRVAEYIVELLNNDPALKEATQKISFVGHSMGGLVQTFALAYLEVNHAWLFRSITPVNFITIASPMVGILHDNPAYITIPLMAGAVGKSGQDLGLQMIGKKPLLLMLPSGPAHRVLKRFHRRTVYANAVNDGIVSLRTASLIFTDYHLCEKISEASTNALPLLAISSYLMPQKQARSDVLPKTSMLESATALFLPPLPLMDYITNPDIRENVVIHDKVYHESDLPPLQGSSDGHAAKGMMHMLTSKGEELRRFVLGPDSKILEEQIAREYHRSMSWRKVLVKLEPDAHNNIVVRRRFANAYGWPVIEHLVSNHFNLDEEDAPMLSDDSTEVATELDLNKDDILKENATIDESVEDANSWMKLEKNCELLFVVGPAGMISDVSEMVVKFRNHWMRGLTGHSTPPDTETTTGVMGSFL